jgi:hypothetical protein
VVTVPDSPVRKPSPVVGVLLTLAALVVAGLMAALSLWLMPFAGVALVTVGWLGLTRRVPRGLAYVVVAVGLVMLVLSLLAFAPA